MISENLIETYLISKYSSNVIKKNNCNKTNEIQIVSKYLKSNYTDINFIKFINKNEFINIKDLVSYIINNINTNSSRGKYHEFMDLIHYIYDVEIIKDLPNYINKDNIQPKRKEYLWCWWIMNKIKTDNFFKDNNLLLTPLYQCKINDNYEKYYDIYYDKLDIIIEIHENCNNHKNNPNDCLKESIIKLKSKIIIYFKISEYDKTNHKYLYDFWNDELRPLLLQGLLNNDENIRIKYCIYKFNKINQQNIININDSLKYYKIQYQENNIEKYKYDKIIKNKNEKLKYLEKYFKSDCDKSLISKIFNWKKLSINNDDYIINIQDIIEHTNYNTVNDLFNHIEENYDFKLKNKDPHITWSILVKIIIHDEDVNKSDKELIMDYLLNVEIIYNNIINEIQKYYEEKLRLTKNMEINTEKYLKNKIKEEYELEINNSKHENEIKKKENKELNKYLTKTNKTNKKILEIINKTNIKKKITKNENKIINEFEVNIKKYNELYSKYVITNITPQKIIGKSIITEIEDFPIIWTNFYDNINQFKYIDFEASCRNHNISKNNIKKFIPRERIYTIY